MRRPKKFVRNMMLIALVVLLTVTNGFYSLADTTEETAPVTDSTTAMQATAGGATYANGTYIGIGSGKKGDIKLTVTIADGVISSVEAEQQETTSYWDQAKEIINTIKNTGNPSANDIDKIDVISGATMSSDGIKGAMKTALATALVDETIFSSGEGTKESPFIIANVVQLQNFAKSVNISGELYTAQYIKLASDMNLSETEWIPIGSDAHPFGGYFDGNGKTISNLSIGDQDSFTTINKAAFFGKISDGAVIKNLIIDNTNIYAVGETGAKAYGAGLVAVSGKNNIIDKCKVINSQIMIKSDDQQFVYAAGLVGYLDQNSSVTNCISDCSIHGESGNYVYAGGIGGLAGNKTLVMNNHISGVVEAEVVSGGYTTAAAIGGGLLGMASGVTYNCYADNAVTVTNNATDTKIYKGSLVAWSTANGCVLNSYYNSSVCNLEPVIINPAGSTFYEGIEDIKDKTAQEIADVLHNNLSSSYLSASKTTMINKAPTKDFGFDTNLTDKVFYDWEVINLKASISDNVWKEKFNPSGIFESGTGTASDPYIIETDEQIRKFAISLSDENTYEGKFISITKDMNVSDKNWVPIGEGEYEFCGTFDGNGHSIEGVCVTNELGNAYDAGNDIYFGLFGIIGKNGTVKNINIKDIKINVFGKGSTVVGGICGVNDGGTIDSCSVTGNLRGQTIEKGNNYAGGITGWSIKGTIVNSYTDASVYSSVLPTALAMSGGIAGMSNRSIIANCYSLGTATGHTQRQLEVVESMAAVGGLVGVAGSPVVNCYTISDTTSEDYSFYVGAAVGWATGISEIYDVYYNKDANQTIQNEKISPITNIGFLVGQGINDEGEAYIGALTYNNQGLTGQEMKSQALVDKLNANFNTFPLNTDTLPENIQLKKWIVEDGLVTFSDEYATRNYVAPDVEKPTLTGDYFNGTFYGRAANETTSAYVTASIEVKDKKITSVICDTTIDGVNDVIETIVRTNQVPNVESTDSTAMAAFKNAVRRAAVKALRGDYTDYAAVELGIFEGGDGSIENPYKISCADQLIEFAASVNEVEHYKNKYIVLTKDIDLLGVQWMPAGGSGLYTFSGTFDGKGHTISNMRIGDDNSPAKYTCAGLFAHTDMATIQNLEIKEGYIHIKPSSIPGLNSERAYAGLLVGYAGITDTSKIRGTVIDHCFVSGQIISDSVESNYVGGVAGTLVHSLLINSYSNCKLKGTSPASWVYAGGLVGLPAFSMIINNAAYGNIYTDAAVNKSQLGGIGGMYSSYGYNNYTDVNLIAKQQTIDIGGMAGRITGVGYISNCFGNAATEQKSGDKVTTGKNKVGTIVKGERYGQGQIDDNSQLKALDQSLVNVLNENRNTIGKESMYDNLVSGWSIYVPANSTYSKWSLKDGKAVFANTQDESDNGGSTPSKSSGGGSKASESSTTYKVKSVVSQNNASVEIKISAIKGSKNLEIESSIANLIFDEKAIQTIISKSNTQISATVNVLEKSALSKDVKDIVGDRPVYEITLTSGNQTISDFGNGKVQVKIPYTLRDGEDSSGIVVYYMNDQSQLIKMETTYDKANKTVTFQTNHFSKYIVGYDTKAAAGNAHFADVSEKAWFKEAVQYVSEKGMMNGISGTTFDPNANSTRAMVCTILWNMENKPEQTAELPFKDVSKTSWYTQAITWANQNQITMGINEDVFAPNEKVTREQLAQFLYNYAKLKGYNVTKTSNLAGYKDKPSVWAEEAVKWAVENQIITGKGNGMIDPKGTATRAEIAQMIMNFNKNI